MKKTVPLLSVRGIILFTLCLLPSALCAGQGENSNKGAAPPDPPSYQASSAKGNQEEAILNIARKEYEICLEHCAADAFCMERCEAAYTRRVQIGQGK